MATKLPKTDGQWAPVYRGRNPATRQLIAYSEVFKIKGCDKAMTIPGVSRWINV